MTSELYDSLASREAARLKVHRSTLVNAIKDRTCSGVWRTGHWWTNRHASDVWYATYYRHVASIESGKAWSDGEIQRLVEGLGRQEPIESIARMLNRSVEAVECQTSRLRSKAVVVRPERDRLRLRLHPRVVDRIVAEAKRREVSIAKLLTWAVLAALDAPKIFSAGERLSADYPLDADTDDHVSR